MAQTEDVSSSMASKEKRSSSPSQLDEAARALESRLGDEATSLGSEAKELAQDIAGRARNNAQAGLAGGKERAVRGLGSVAHALRHTGEQLRQQDEESLPRYIETAAEKLDSLSGYLRGRELQDVAADVENFARREPALFVGGAFALGLIGGRFLKSSRSAGVDGQPGSRGSQSARRQSGVSTSRTPGDGSDEGDTGTREVGLGTRDDEARQGNGG